MVHITSVRFRNSGNNNTETITRKLNLALAKVGLNSLPNDKILDLTKLKASERAKNIVGKGENACYQHFLLFPQCFQKVTFSVGIVW